MALKDFKELYKVNIKADIKKKPTFFKNDAGKLQKNPENKWLDYLEWATVITLLYDNGAESVTFGCLKNSDGYPAFFVERKNPFVSIWVKIDDKRYEIEYPVIDGNKVDDVPNQMTIHKAQQRAFVKCVAINTGLGLKLWQKEESDFEEVTNTNHLGLPELLPNTDKWSEAIKSLKNGFKLTQILKRYYISDENQSILMDESI
jgi:hypothetical protein